MHYLQCLRFSSRENSLNSHIKVYRFCHFLKFRFKKRLYKSQNISKYNKKRQISIDFWNPRNISFLHYYLRFYRNSKLHVEKFTLRYQGFRKIVLNISLTCDVIITSLWSHVPHFSHSIT